MISISKAIGGNKVNRKYLVLLTTTIALIVLSFTLPANAAEPSEPHAGNAMWVEPSNIDLRNKPVGYKFNITLWINFTSIDPGNEIGAWQYVVVYEKAYLTALRAGYTGGTMSEWYTKVGVTQTMPITPSFASFNDTHNYVLHGETWLGGPKAPEGTYGSLSWIEFNVTATPTEQFSGTFGFITTGIKRSKLLDEENRDAIAQFGLYEAVYVIPEFAPLILLISLISITSAVVLLSARLRKTKQ